MQLSGRRRQGLSLRPVRALVVPLALAAGCAMEAASPAEPPAPDRAVFDAQVYPVLLRDCGFVACHGDASRYFRVFGPGRARLDPGTARYAPPSDAERGAAFDRARSMLAGVSDPAQSLLLRKPLEAGAGGAAHMGRDALGRNVYADRDALGWRTLAAWAGLSLEPLDGGAAADAAHPDGAARDAALDGEVPDGAVPDGDVPDSDVLDGDVLDGDVPDAGDGG